jgi:hypothetical protein
MATTYYSQDDGSVVQMTGADTLRLRFALLDAANPGQYLTGVTYDQLTSVYVVKPGAAAVVWATIVGGAWATSNFAELGQGIYNIIIHGNVAGELALLDTTGAWDIVVSNSSNLFYPVRIARHVVTADALRQDAIFLGTDHLAKVSTDPQDLSGYLSVNAKNIGGKGVTVDAGGTTLPAVVGSSTFAGGAVASVSGDVGGNVNGKVLGGGAGVIAAVGVQANATQIGGQAATAPAGVAFPAAVGTSVFAGGAVSGVSGDVAGKVLGGGVSTITGVGAWAAGGAGLAIALGTDLATLAGKFTGITLLANWLRAFGRSDTADTTAKTEINTGGGTYDETAASLQALRARGDSAWKTATGFSTLAAGDILVTPANKLATNSSGQVALAVTPAVAGDKMDLINVPNATAVTAIQSGLAKATDLTALAGKFTGITSVAAWWRGLYRKSTMDATAKAEVNVGASAPEGYDESWMSLEGMADWVAPALDVEHLPNMIEDAGDGNWRFTQTALEEGPVGGGASVEDIADRLLVAPANKLLTDAEGNVTATNGGGLNEQQTRDAMTLPTSQEVQAGSIDQKIVAGGGAPTVGEIAAAVLVTPENLLATDAEGRVTTANPGSGASVEDLLNASVEMPGGVVVTVAEALCAAAVGGAYDEANEGTTLTKFAADGTAVVVAFTITYDINNKPIARVRQ